MRTAALLALVVAVAAAVYGAVWVSGRNQQLAGGKH